jgi:hypothetical protein
MMKEMGWVSVLCRRKERKKSQDRDTQIRFQEQYNLSKSKWAIGKTPTNHYKKKRQAWSQHHSQDNSLQSEPWSGSIQNQGNKVVSAEMTCKRRASVTLGIKNLPAKNLPVKYLLSVSLLEYLVARVAIQVLCAHLC